MSRVTYRGFQVKARQLKTSDGIKKLFHGFHIAVLEHELKTLEFNFINFIHTEHTAAKFYLYYYEKKCRCRIWILLLLPNDEGVVIASFTVHACENPIVNNMESLTSPSLSEWNRS